MEKNSSSLVKIWPKSHQQAVFKVYLPLHSRVLECTPRQQRWRAVTREPVEPFSGRRGQLPRGRQGCARGSHCPFAKGTSSKARKNWVHGGSHQTTGGGDPEKDQVSGMDQSTGSREREMARTVLNFFLAIEWILVVDCPNNSDGRIKFGTPKANACNHQIQCFRPYNSFNVTAAL